MVDAVETMVSGSGMVPWHSKGTVIQGLMTSAEALKLSGLDWRVEKVPLFAKVGPDKYTSLPDRFGVQRSSDGRILGVVGRDYSLVQNEQAFLFVDTLIDSSDAVYDTAGSLHDGKRVWLLAKLPDGVKALGDDDHDVWILFSNSHDGTRAVTAAVVIVRVVCANTETLALNSAKAAWTVRHRGAAMGGKLTEARQALGLTFTYLDEWKLEMERLAKVIVSDERLDLVLRSALPEQKRATDKHLESVRIIRRDSELIPDELRDTGYGAWLATTEWLSHRKGWRSDDAKLKALTFTWGPQFNQKIWAGLTH